MASLGALIIELLANTGSFETDMGRAAKIAEKRAKDINAHFSKMARNAIGAFTAIFSAGAVKSAIQQSIQLGDELAKAAQKSGIAAEEFTALAHAAKMSDVDISGLSASIRKMQVNLSSGSQGTKAALRAIGLEIEAIRDLSPDAQFSRIGDAISRVKDPADRARAAVDLFGKAGADLLPLFSEGAAGLAKAKEEAKSLGLVFDADQLKKFSEADDAIKRLNSRWDALASTLTLKVAPALAGILDDIRAGLGGLTKVEGISRQISGLEERAGQILGSRGGDRSRLAPEELRQLVELETQLLELRRRRRLLEAPATHNRGATLREDAPGYAAVDAAAEWAKESAKILEDLEKLSVDASAAAARMADEASDEIVESINRQVEARDEAVQADKAYLKFLDDFYADIDDSTKTSLERQTDALEAFRTKIDLLIANGLDPEIAKARLKEFERSFDELSVYADQAARNMQDSFADFLFDPFEGGLKGMLKSFIDTIRRMVAEAASAKIFEALGGGKTGSAGGVLGSFLGGILGFADGGRPPMNRLSVVGERGPEFFVPDTPGTIVPFNKVPQFAGGNVTVHNEIHLHNIRDVSDAKLAAAGQQISDVTIGRLRDMKRRGRF